MKIKLPRVHIPYIKYISALLTINILLCGVVILIRDNLPPIVPLLYGRPRGEEQLVPQMFLLLPPMISILVTIVNAAFTTITEDTFIKRVLIGISFAATLLSIITVIKIILLVGNL